LNDRKARTRDQVEDLKDYQIGGKEDSTRGGPELEYFIKKRTVQEI